MGKKDRQFSKSQEWLDWLSDERAVKHTAAPQKPSREPLEALRPIQTLSPRPYAQKPLSRPVQNQPSRSLGLDSSAFRTSPQPPQQTTSKARTSLRAKKRQPRTAANSDGTITVNFHLPSLKLPKVTIHWRKVMLYGGVSIVVVGVMFGTPFIIKAINDRKTSSPSETTTASDKPAFSTILPAKDTDGYVQMNQTYDSTKQIYYFRGQYNGIDIVGTEQAIPEVFKTNKNKLKDQATSIGATEPLDVVGGMAYVSPSEGSTSQRAIYASSQILVFVTYSGVMKSSDWVKFLQSLE